MAHMDKPIKVKTPKAERRQFLVGPILLLVVVFIAGVTYLVRGDYKRSIDEAEDQLVYFAELFEKSVESNLAIANLQMWNMIDRIELNPLWKTDDIESRYGDFMRNTLKQVDQIDSLSLIDSDGTVVWSSVVTLNDIYLGDREYFQKALQLGMNEYAVGMPLISRGTGRRLTPIAWPIVSPSKQVLGVVVSSLGEDYFSDILTLTDIPADMHVDILALDGSAAFQSRDKSPSAGTRVIRASRNVAGLDLTINVSRSQKAVMAGFAQRTTSFLVVAIVLFASSIGMAIRLHAKTVQLATGLKQSVQDNFRIVAAQREFNAIFENVGDGIVIFTKDGHLKRTNKMARKILGQDNSRLAIDFLMASLPEFSEIHNDSPIHLIKTDKGQVVQCRVMKLTTDDQEIAYCVLSDVTAEERLAHARDNFVTSVNHELRTPLTSLSGALDILEDRFFTDFSDPAKRLVRMASRNADRLLMLVNDILTLQAIDQGKFHVRAKAVPVNDALEEAIATNEGYGLGTGVSLVCEQSEQSIIWADPDRLQQIFSNLISNAIKYSPANGSVKIGARKTKDEIEFYVSDDGPGIPESARERLFDRFTTPIHENGVQMNGTGLGLAITKQLVERQDGTITFKTQTDADGAGKTGTVFFVTFKQYSAPVAPLEVNT
jgi:signal transduction histidine kinase